MLFEKNTNSGEGKLTLAGIREKNCIKLPAKDGGRRVKMNFAKVISAVGFLLFVAGLMIYFDPEVILKGSKQEMQTALVALGIVSLIASVLSIFLATRARKRKGK